MLALLLGVVATVCRANAHASPGVDVELSGERVFVSAEQIAASVDVATTPYRLRLFAADPGTLEQAAGVSIRQLIAIAGGNPDVVTGVTIGTGAASVYLPGADLAQPPPFVDGPPLVWVTGEETHFLRPLRDATDVNGGDRLTAGAGTPLTLDVQSGSILEVTASADKQRIQPGGRVELWASALGATDGERLTYRWTFGDGTVSEGQEVTHVYRRAGRYRAFVTVAGSARSGGASRAVTITVGERDDKPAEAKKEEEEEANPGAGGAASGQFEPPADPPSTGDTTNEASPGAPPAAGKATKPSPKRDRSGRRPGSANDDQVTGVLIDDPRSLAPAAPPTVAAAGLTRNGSGEAVDPLVWAGIASLLLVVAGASRERHRLSDGVR